VLLVLCIWLELQSQENWLGNVIAAGRKLRSVLWLFCGWVFCLCFSGIFLQFALNWKTDRQTELRMGMLFKGGYGIIPNKDHSTRINVHWHSRWPVQTKLGSLEAAWAKEFLTPILIIKRERCVPLFCNCLKSITEKCYYDSVINRDSALCKLPRTIGWSGWSVSQSAGRKTHHTMPNDLNLDRH